MKYKLENIIYEVTTDCNFDCKYCYNIWKRPLAEGEKNENERKNSYSKATKTLKKLFSIADVNSVTMTGGEPFLSERFKELVLYTRMQKKEVVIITNGNAATEEDFTQLIDIGVGTFELTINSYDKKIHNKMAGAIGWDKTVNVIKQIVQMQRESRYKGSVVGVIVVTKYNYAEIEKTLRFIHSLGVTQIMLNRYNIGGKSLGNLEDIVLKNEELKKVYSIANELSKELGLTIYSSVCTPFCILDPKDYRNIVFSSCSDDVSKRPLTLDIDGNIRFCNHSPVVLGNIHKDSLEKIFNSDNAKKWSETVPDYCNNCNKYEQCRGGCRAASEQIGMGLGEVDPVIKF